MRKRLFILSLLVISVSLISGKVFAWGGNGGDGGRYSQLQETAVFFNNSGATLVCGEIVVLDRTGTGVTAGTTLGAYVTRTTTADASGVVGVVKSESAVDQSPVIVVTRGPAQVKVLDSSDAVQTNQVIGTSTTNGFGGRYSAAQGVGSGIVGYAMEAGAGNDTCAIWTWVEPS